MKIPGSFIDQKVHVSLKTPIQGPGGVGFLTLTSKDKVFPVLVSQDAETIVLRTSVDTVFGPPGEYTVDKRDTLCVGKVSSITQVPAGTRIQVAS